VTWNPWSQFFSSSNSSRSSESEAGAPISGGSRGASLLTRGLLELRPIETKRRHAPRLQRSALTSDSPMRLATYRAALTLSLLLSLATSTGCCSSLPPRTESLPAGRVERATREQLPKWNTLQLMGEVIKRDDYIEALERDWNRGE